MGYKTNGTIRANTERERKDTRLLSKTRDRRTGDTRETRRRAIEKTKHRESGTSAYTYIAAITNLPIHLSIDLPVYLAVGLSIHLRGHARDRRLEQPLGKDLWKRKQTLTRKFATTKKPKPMMLTHKIIVNPALRIPEGRDRKKTDGHTEQSRLIGREFSWTCSCLAGTAGSF